MRITPSPTATLVMMVKVVAMVVEVPPARDVVVWTPMIVGEVRTTIGAVPVCVNWLVIVLIHGYGDVLPFDNHARRTFNHAGGSFDVDIPFGVARSVEIGRKDRRRKQERDREKNKAVHGAHS